MYQYRARCLRVVDGDTFDLEVDCGFHLRFSHRFRLLGVDACELGARDPEVRAKAVAARSLAADHLMREGPWPLVVETAKDPDNFGRWLARVAATDGTVLADLGELLVARGLAVLRTR